MSKFVKWLFRSNETTNFSHELEKNNTRYLVSFIADIANTKFNVAMAYITKIEEDRELRKHISAATAKPDWSFLADKKVRFGRRIGWYALTKILKSKTVIETGVGIGFGACVFTAALKGNNEEGYEAEEYRTIVNKLSDHAIALGDNSHDTDILLEFSLESNRHFVFYQEKPREHWYPGACIGISFVR